MRGLNSAAILGLLVGVGGCLGSGCSSDDDAGASGTACETSDDCVHWECVCADGSKPSAGGCISNRCAEASELCGGMCENYGGLVSTHEKPSVKDSPECDAFCAKAASLACGDEPRCNRYFWCGLGADECADTKRANLKCRAETGDWQCTETGGWSMSSSCPSAQCSSDAGSD